MRFELETDLSDDCPITFGTEHRKDEFIGLYLMFEDRRYGQPPNSWTMRIKPDQAKRMVLGMAEVLGMKIIKEEKK